MLALVSLLFGVSFAHRWTKEVSLEEFKEMNTLKEFNDWAKHFGKKYATQDEAASRFLTWVDNMFVIAETNSKGLSYKFRANQFTDLTGDEFRYYVHGKDGRCFKPDEIAINLQSRNDDSESSESSESSKVSNPSSVAWQDKGVVTPVKNQGQCGSCWAFSTTGALECDYAIKTGSLNSLSEQQLVDCANYRYGCYGCNGGQMTGGLTYAKNEGGLCLEKNYPYTASNGNCKATTCGSKYDHNSDGYNSVTRDSASSMETAAASGCVSIGIEADQYAFQHYSSGVLTGTCGTSIDHGVLLTGYGTENGEQYWWVKNSWGTSWGLDGYVKICKECGKNGKAGECGILQEGNVPEF